MTARSSLVLAGVALAACWVAAWPARPRAAGAAATGDGPKYASGTDDLIRPADYREWVFLSSSLGLQYRAVNTQTFGNVFVNPSSYRGFMKTGKWPDKTIFVLEFRNSGTQKLADRRGTFQTDVNAVEAEVKDSRFPDGWAFYGFSTPARAGETAAPMAGAAVAPCVDCHSTHTAVERTFVQFYPTLLEVARRMGTIKPNYTEP
jgi:Cytochrome P460